MGLLFSRDVNCIRGINIFVLIGTLLFCVATTYFYGRYSAYVAVNRERLNPLGIVDSNNKLNEEEYRVAMFGDSRALEWGRVLNANQIPTLNLGVANQSSVQARYRIDYQSENLDLDWIIIQIGINDLKQIDTDGNNYLAIVNQCKKSIDYIARKSRLFAKKVVVSTVFPISEPPLWRRIFISSEVKRAISEVNEYIRAMEGVEIFDAHTILVGADGYAKNIYTLDTLHVNQRAYKDLNIQDFLK